MKVRLRNVAPAWWVIETTDGVHLAAFPTEAKRARYLGWHPGWRVVE